MKNLIIIIAILVLGISEANAQCCMPINKKTTAENISHKTGETINLKITGVTCAGCSNLIYTELKAVDGVLEHSVEYPGNFATITYDPAKTNPDAIIKVIEKTGFNAEIIKETKKNKA